MKKYRLKKWYPSLLKDVRVGDIITENGQHYKGVTYKCISYRVEIWQLHPDFWELIEEKKPLFTTDDGMKVSNPEDWVYLVNSLFEKIERYARNSNINKEIVKVFYYEANADDYILWNKPIFSYNDIKKFQLGGDGVWYDVKAIAKERAGNGK